MDHHEAPRVLLGNLSPIMVIGMARVLTEDGAEVIGQYRQGRDSAEAAVAGPYAARAHLLQGDMSTPRSARP